MKASLAPTLVLCACLLAAWGAQAQPASAPASAPAPRPACAVEATVAQLQKAPRLAGGYALTGSSCHSLRQVFARLLGSSSGAGLKLEKDKALDLPAAQRERSRGLADAEFATALAGAQAGEHDPLRRLVLEAALHEDFGHYAARDLLLREARQQMER